MTNSGKSYFVQRLVDDLENLFDVRMVGGVFYCHPAGNQLATLRKNSIVNMQRSCEHAGVPFTEVHSDIPSFLEGLRRNDLPRLVILDDISDVVFKTKAFAELFNVTAHHYQV